VAENKSTHLSGNEAQGRVNAPGSGVKGDSVPWSLDQRITFPLCAIIFFSVLNGVMFNVAIPSIKAEYGLIPSEASWVMTGYIIIFALGSIIYGKLADSRRVRDLITLGLLLFNAGSFIGIFSVNYPMLIAARSIQAAGASAIPALAMIVATRYFPPHLKGRVLGAIASTVAFSGGVGPVLGGFIAGAFHWRYLFPPTLITLIVLPHLRRMLPHTMPEGRKFDLRGAVILGLGVALVLVFVTEGITYALVAGSALLLWFIVHIYRTGVPFIKPALFHNRRFRNSIILTFIATGAVFGMFFMVPIMLNDIYGHGPKMIGLVMFPGAMSAAFVGTYGGRLADKKGGRFMVFVGVALYITSFVILSSIAGQGALPVGIALVMSYIGFSFLQSSLPHTVSSELPPEDTGIGMGIYTLFFFIAGAFSAAVIGRVLDLGSAGFCLNPLSLSCGPRVWLYSNIFLALAFVLFLGAVLFWRTFRDAGPDTGRAQT
jgi:DHA2 family metal-tetracycline-proton antiporter-like MFS transporter